MLDAACCGEVFTSPTPDQMQEATTVVDRGAGVLHIVKNYTGDVMNFEMAGEMAAADSGVRVETVVTDDDVAVQDSTWTAGRRGVGVTVLLEKIVGAAAEEGRDLDAVVELAKRVNGQGRSMGMALTSCTVPSAGKPTFDLPEDEMEMGVGIHGEPGRRRVPLAGAAEIAEQLVEPVLADLDFTGRPEHRAAQRHGRHAAHRAVPVVRRGGDAAREGRGAGRPDPRRRLHHLARHGRRLGDGAQGRRRDGAPVGCSGEDSGPAMGTLTVTDAVSVDQLVGWLSSFRDAVHEHGAYLTELDSAIGDADHGANLIRGMDAVMAAVDSDPPATAGDLLKKVGMTLVTSVGGASGPLYGTFFLRAATAVGDATVARRRGVARVPSGPDSRGSWREARPRPATRRCTTRWRPRWRRSSRRWLPAPTSVPPRERRPTRPPPAATRPSRCSPSRGGRRYLGERSVGHIDPGAASSALLLAALADTLES